MLNKIKMRLWALLVRKLRKRACYPLIYRSWWHSRIHQSKRSGALSCYLAATPNPGAGIGHQLANWIAGLWFAKRFGLPHAHIPFSSQRWEQLLGLGEPGICVESLVREHGCKKVLLPLFDESNSEEVQRIRRIISSYANQPVVFILEQDQFYRDQFGVMGEIQNRFYRASSRAFDRMQYRPENFNIAIHVRRGDIAAGQVNGNPNLLMRWQDAKYFKSVLAAVLNNLKMDKLIKIHLFSQGNREEFTEFERFGNVLLHLDMGAQESFLHMVYADLLITSKSSFSYKPALLNQGVKVCPRNFWHGYPDQDDWVIAEEDGSLDEQAIMKLKNMLIQSKGF